MKRLAALLRIAGVAASVSTLASCGRASVPPPSAPAPDGAAPAAPVAVRPPVAPLPDDLEPPPALPTSETVKIKLVAEPRRQARIYWGRKDLGLAPLEIVRPKGSGPLDLLVIAPGYLPLHTRVFADRDDTLVLRLYTETDAAALPGWKRL